MNHLTAPLWAFWDFESMTQTIVSGNKIFLGIRIVVAVIGAALGFFISAPIFRGLYYLVIRKAMPLLLHVPLRLMVACVVGAALFFFLPIGSGGFGGLGSGGGKGDGVGPGMGDKGTGPGSNNNNSTNPNSTPNDSAGPEPTGPERISIVLLGGKEYRANGKFVHGEGKFYKVKTSKSESVMTLKELDDLLGERKGQIASVNLILTGQSVGGGPREKLKELIQHNKIKLTVTQ